MMKAKEHYQIYLHDEKIVGPVPALQNLIKRLWDEVDELKRIRNCQHPQAEIAVYREICSKWDAFCRLDPTFKRGGLRELIVDKMPPSYQEQIRKVLT